MSLKEQLEAQKARVVEMVPPEVLSVMLDKTEELAKSEIVNGTPKLGDQLQGFNLPNQKGEQRSLTSLLENGPVVVTFYRGGWCPYCNLELQAYQKHLAEIKAQGATLVAITPELPDASLSTTEKNELEFEVLTDANSDYARSLGLVFTLPEELRLIYENFGIKVEEHNGPGQFDLPLAATFVVDTQGAITFAMVDADYTLRAEPADVVEAIAALTSKAS